MEEQILLYYLRIFSFLIIFFLIFSSYFLFFKEIRLKNNSFNIEKNESLKKVIISSILEGLDQDTIKSRISLDYQKLIDEIQENSSIQIILRKKDNEAVLGLLNELIAELKELNNLKKIESLEKKLINNLDENSFSELIKLKSQINRD